MNRVNFHSPLYTYPIVIETEKNVDVYVDCFEMSPVPDGAIRIIELNEPMLTDYLYNCVQNYKDFYTYVLTHREDILATNPKAKLFWRTNSWVKGYVSKEKKFSVSTVVGGKNDVRMSGYALRHDLWRNKDLITIPKDFYLSGDFRWTSVDYTANLVLGPTKEPLFDSMFHIAIENIPIKDMFSEKLIDCFQTRTVPVYCGCLNISDYFNINGIIIVKNLSEIITSCNNLTPKTYEDMMPAMEDNFNRSQDWCDDMGRFKNAIIKLLNENI